MGAMEFYTTGQGADVREAFDTARDEAAYQHGRRGYTGSLAEKSEYTVIDPPAADQRAAVAQARTLMNDEDPRVDDKWGPAGAIRYTDPDAPAGAEAWLFFGVAPS